MAINLVWEKKVFRQLTVALLLSVFFTHLYEYMVSAKLIDSWEDYVADVLFGTLYFSFYYAGYQYINRTFKIRFSRQRLSIKRIALALLSFLVFSIVLLWGMRSLFLWLLSIFISQENGPADNELRLVYVAMAIVSFLYYVFFTFLQLTKDIQNTSLQAERLQRERAQAQFNTLKNQISPHFLFNTFNTLSSLIYIEEEEKTVQFIQELKSVFRYILDNRNRELVELQTELDFVRAYFYLLKIRFKESIQLALQLPESVFQYEIPPLTLQMLIENAVKHNAFSKAEPLHIDITADGQYLQVRNNRQARAAMEADSHGIGLQNIINRYRYLTDMKVEVNLTERVFSAKIPLIQHVQ